MISNPSLILGPGDWSKGSSQIFQKINNSGLKFYTEEAFTGYVDVMDVATVQYYYLNLKLKMKDLLLMEKI